MNGTPSTPSTPLSNSSTATPSAPYPGGPRLVADIGGTNVRFALEISRFEFRAISTLPSKDYAGLKEAITAYLASPEVQGVHSGKIRTGALAIANPIVGDHVKMTNRDWSFSIKGLQSDLGFDKLLVINDFTALAMALPHLSAEQKRQIGGGAAQSGKTIGLLGPGTGLGMSGIIPAGERWLPLQSEGGHATFSPANEREIDILRFCWREHPHVSAERLLSGMGLESIYQALAEQAGKSVSSVAEKPDAATIGQRAVDGTCDICRDTVELFCGMLGTAAANLALTLGAAGGMYLGGGIISHLGALFDNSSFRVRFEAMGRFSAYLSEIPTFVITAEYPAFLGVSVMLQENEQESEQQSGQESESNK